MYVDRIRHRSASGKITVQYLLRTSHREGKKTIKTTLLNITPWGEEVCEAIALALKHKSDITEIVEQYQAAQKNGPSEVPFTKQGKSIGSVWLLEQLAVKLGIVDALGDSPESRLALWQILARTIDQGSRLSAVRMARTYEIDFLCLGPFSEDDLYKNLDWIAKNQDRIEDALYKKRHGDKPCQLFLYDVTSSYFEGVKNELARFGYNRDKKKGKMQIVVGLLCDEDGEPVSVEVFQGNTNDVKTLHSQIQKVAKRFHVKQVVFVGDRGMIKTAQQEELRAKDYDFITALTRPQIESLLRRGSIQLEFFDETIHEVVLDDGARYVMKRNPVRAAEIASSRRSKLYRLEQFLSGRNAYLKEHPKARTETAYKHAVLRAKRLKIDSWTKIEVDEAGRSVRVVVDDDMLNEVSRLDGCYCLTTSVDREEMDKESVHASYKDLAMVENAFRTCKTGQLELRPIYVRKEGRTRAHVFVVMLSYLLVRKLREDWKGLDMTVEEGLELLSRLATVHVGIGEGKVMHAVPKPNKSTQQLFDLAGIASPEILPGGKTIAASKRKLTERRKS